MIRFYNTINRQKEEFKTIEKGKVLLYTCGPTVYDYAHIGNFRAYIFEDLLRRFLEYKNYEVLHVMNITDIDDKTINKCISQNIPLKDFTDQYTQYFFDDVKKINILPAHHYPRATDFIPEMISMIESLEKKGYTYTTSDNSVFFRIDKFKDYGKLANLNPDDMKTGERVDLDEYEKEEGRDFALWKGYKKEDGDVFWDSPWGKGRPGWHIECSVMSTHYLGSHFDIHCGGVDNIFPHHENEIAQSQCALDDKFVNYWLHNEHLLVDSKKMSKSLGNFYTIRELLDKGYSSSSIRYALISSNYRHKLNFTFSKLEDSKKAVNKLKELNRRLDVNDIKHSDNECSKYDQNTQKFLQDFDTSLSDDLNISGALGALFVWVNYLFVSLDNKRLSKSQIDNSKKIFFKIDSVLGVLDHDVDDLEEDIKDLIGQREKARFEKKWELADQIRKKLLDLNISLEDTPEGTIWKKNK